MTIDTLLELLPQAAVRVDAGGRLVDRNQLAAALFGPAGPLGASDLADALAGLPGFPEWLAGNGADLFHGRLQARRTNGVPVTVEIDARRLHGEGAGGICTLRELDRLRVAEESQRYFDVAFDAAPIGMALFNTDGEYVRVNAALCAFLGRAPQDLIGRRDQEFTHPGDRQSDVDAAWRILRGEIHTWQCEKRFVRPDGSIVWAIANLTFLRDANGNPMTWVGQFQDITRRKSLEVDLSQRERRTRQILETAHDAFISVDEHGRVVEWNPQAERLFGWARDEVLGTDLIDAIIPARDHQAHRRSIALLLGGDRTILGHLFEITAVHRGGREFPIELTISAHDRGGAHTFNAFLRDISDRKRTEERLRMAHAAAVEASRLKSAFVANISHEIRTPLNGVIGTSMLLLETPLNDEQREYVDALRASGDALMTLVDDILDFSKIEAGKLEIGVDPFDVRDVVEEVSAIFAAAAHAKEIELSSWVDDGVPATLLGDRHRIRQVVANLVGNAVKFTITGEVSVSVSAGAEAAGTVALQIAVADTGIGIEPPALERIFESFSQGDGSTTRRFGGTGLGLAISKQLVDLMDGEIGVESAPGRGSTFRFSVPLAVADPGTTHRSGPRVPELTGVRILVLDANPTSSAGVQRLVSGWGMRCSTAPDSATALAMLTAAHRSGDPFRVVVLDDRRDVTGLARAVGANPSHRHTGLVLTTAPGYDRSAATQAGIQAFVHRPIRRARLRDALVGLLSDAAPAGPSSQPEAQVPGVRPRRGLVLVADDNAINQLVAVQLLQKRGFTVDLAGNGREALDRHAQNRYEAIFMDCQMPEVDGYEATAEIRRREGARRHTPVIAMTASTMKGDRERCLDAGMDHYIGKPMHPDSLDDVIAEVIPLDLPAHDQAG